MDFMDAIDKHLESRHTWRPSDREFTCGQCAHAEIERGGIWFGTKGHRIFVPDRYIVGAKK